MIAHVSLRFFTFLYVFLEWSFWSAGAAGSR